MTPEEYAKAVPKPDPVETLVAEMIRRNPGVSFDTLCKEVNERRKEIPAMSIIYAMATLWKRGELQSEYKYDRVVFSMVGRRQIKNKMLETGFARAMYNKERRMNRNVELPGRRGITSRHSESW